MPVPAMPEVAFVPMGTHIPRIIHQTYPTKTLPDALRQMVDALRKSNPGWEYRLYDDADIEAWIEEHYGREMLRFYLRIDKRYGAARVDFWRYLLIYKVGGVYIDIKSTFTKPLNEVIRPDDKFLLSSWSKEAYDNGYGVHEPLSHRTRGEFQQWHVIGTQGHPFLRAVIAEVMANIDRYNPWRDGVAKWAVIRITGPIVYTLTIERLLTEHPHREVEDESYLGLDYNPLKGENYHKYLPKHYIFLTTPVVKPSKFSHKLYYIRIVIKYIFDRLKGVLQKS